MKQELREMTEKLWRKGNPPEEDGDIFQTPRGEWPAEQAESGDNILPSFPVVENSAQPSASQVDTGADTGLTREEVYGSLQSLYHTIMVEVEQDRQQMSQFSERMDGSQVLLDQRLKAMHG